MEFFQDIRRIGFVRNIWIYGYGVTGDRITGDRVLGDVGCGCVSDGVGVVLLIYSIIFLTLLAGVI